MEDDRMTVYSQRSEDVLASIKKAQITEVKAFKSPPARVISVIKLVGKILQKDCEWKVMLGNAEFLKTLKDFDPRSIKDWKPIVTFVSSQNLDSQESILISKKVSNAIASIHAWCLEVLKFAV